MNHLFDLGNTRLKFAAWPGEGPLQATRALVHGGAGFADDLRAALGGRLAGDAWLASVAPPALTQAVAAVLAEAGARVRLARSEAALDGLRVAYADPAQLGVDRFLALLAARAGGEAPCLLVSAGSALTVDLLAADGRHLGGLIAPSPDHARASLAARFPALDRAGGEPVDFAGNTADAVAGGSLGAALGLVERCHRLAGERLGRAPALLLSGGDAARLAAALPMPVQLRPDLVLEGLARYAGAGAGVAP